MATRKGVYKSDLARLKKRIVNLRGFYRILTHLNKQSEANAITIKMLNKDNILLRLRLERIELQIGKSKLKRPPLTKSKP